MKMNSSHLEAIHVIAKTRNFTRAAEALFVTQSALSQRIAKLEAELETTLFVRDRAEIRLTEAGEELLRFCQMNESAEFDLLLRLRGSKDDLAGIIRIGGFSSVNRSMVIPAVAKLMAKHPKLSLNLITKELKDLPDLLKSSEVDYVLTNKKSDSSEIESIFLGYEVNVMAQAKNNKNEDVYLDHDESDVTTKSYFAQNKIPQPKKITMRYLDDVYGLLDGVRHEYGKAVLPMHLIENEKGIEVIDPKSRLVVPVYLSFYVQPYYRRVHSFFVKEITDYFGDCLRQTLK